MNGNGGFNFTNLKNKLSNLLPKETVHEDKDIKYRRDKNSKQKNIDDILDKINRVGYNNLTNAEKQKLKNN